MQYPLYVQRDSHTGFRACFPDFPNADASGDSFDELKRNAQAVVELMYDHSEQLIPAPTCNTSELHTLDMDDGEGIWMFVDINLARVTSKAVGLQLTGHAATGVTTRIRTYDVAPRLNYEGGRNSRLANRFV
jgi:predicted RNase H-like HicB family nuclease